MKFSRALVFTALVATTVFAGSSGDDDKKTAKKVIKDNDKDGDGQLDLNETLAACDKGTFGAKYKDNKAECTKIFNEADSDKNGKISQSELTKFFKNNDSIEDAADDFSDDKKKDKKSKSTGTTDSPSSSGKSDVQKILKDYTA